MIKVNVYADEAGTKQIKPLSVWPTRIYLKNEGDVVLHKATVDLSGDATEMIQLAIDLNGEPGIWAAPGMGIIPLRKPVKPGESIPFWVRVSDSKINAIPFRFEVDLVGNKS